MGREDRKRVTRLTLEPDNSPAAEASWVTIVRELVGHESLGNQKTRTSPGLWGIRNGMDVVEKVGEGTRGTAALSGGKAVLTGKASLQQAMLPVHSH